MNKLLFFLLIQFPLPSAASPPVTLDSCIQWAYDHYEYEKQAMAYRESAELADKNVVKSWYPSLLLDGNATYQNENINIPIDSPVPGLTIPDVPLNFNRLLVQFNQTIYDGSMTAHKRALEKSKYSLLEKKIETEKVKIKSKVISLYMSALLASDNIALLQSKLKVVQERLKVLKSASEYGAVPVVNIKSLEAEIMKIEQQIKEAEHSRQALLVTLSEITGKKSPEIHDLAKPEPVVVFDNNVDGRPEIQLLDMQIENYELQKKLTGVSRNPRINAYGSVGGGYPGYNIFKDEVAFMAMIGLGLKWNIIDYGKTKNEKQILTINQNIALMEQNRARTQLLAELKGQREEIAKMKDLLVRDDEMITLRAEISRIKASELDNGTITSTDYITELNLEEEARLNRAIHELKLILAELNYLTIQGK